MIIDEPSPQIVREVFSHLIYQSLDFVIPNEDEIDLLITDQALYREYRNALGWMQDYLSKYSTLPLHSRVTKLESKKFIQDIISSDLMTPLIDNLVKNQAIVLRFSETAETSPNSESVTSLIDNFLNKMADFLNLLSEAQRNGDKDSLTAKNRSQKSAEIEALKAHTSWSITNDALNNIIMRCLKFQPEKFNELMEEAILLPED